MNGDTNIEGNETFPLPLVNLTNVVNATLLDGTGVGTILNDDVPLRDSRHPGHRRLVAVRGQSVRTTGIVTARKFNNGFFLQAPDADADGDSRTSEGIFVFTSSAPPASATIGNLVQVTGTVSEFSPPRDPNSPPLTEIVSPTVTRHLERQRAARDDAD